MLILLACTVVLAAFGCLMVGSSGMTVSACLDALLGRTGGTAARIIWGIRIPRLLAALIAGAGLSVSGLLMQTSLGNAMASPSTLGVSHAAVFGANLSIIAFAGGFLNTGHNPANFDVGVNPFAASLLAFLFAAASILLILGLCRLRVKDNDVKGLVDSMEYSLMAGGKRIRPKLVLEFCKACGGNPENALAFACAVEMQRTR